MSSFVKKDHRAKKSENADPRAKLLLRRYMLDKYHPFARIDPTPEVRARRGDLVDIPRVFDACQAGGLLWDQLRTEYRVRYWGVDLKPQRKGTLKMDSVRVLTQRGLPFDVIDIDTFGAPWSHWLALLANITKPTTVFLTLGHVAGINEVGSDALDWLGLSKLVPLIPAAIRWRVSTYAADSLLSAPLAFGWRIVEAKEATESKNARYIGVRLER